MDHDEYLTLSDCYFYTLTADGQVIAYAFNRHRDRNTFIWAKRPISGFVDEYGNRDVRVLFMTDHEATDIPKSKTGEWIDAFMSGAEHLPFGCTDEGTMTGDYWMYPEEADVTDPVPPLTDRVGIIEWAVHTDTEEERFFGRMDQAVGRLRAADISAATDAINSMFGDDRSYRKGKGPGESHAWLSVVSKPDIAFTTDCGGLAMWEDGKRTCYLSVKGLNLFTQRKTETG